jgi:hypothetical protein
MTDSVHLNDTGYAILGRASYVALRDVHYGALKSVDCGASRRLCRTLGFVNGST